MTNSVAIIPRLAIRYGLILTAVLLVGGSVIGYLVAGTPGLLSAVIGAVLTAVFMGLTAGSILIGIRVTKGDSTNPVFYGIVLGVLTLKLVVFIVLILVLRGQDWLQPAVLGVSMIVAVIGSLTVDIMAFVRARVPYVDVELPPANP
jgi:hypothetical protein